MASTSEVKAGLSSVAETIDAARKQCAQAKVRISAAKATLANIPTQYAAVKTEIDGFTPTGAFEALAKDELAKLIAEYQALLSEITDAETDLSAYSAF